MDFERRVLGSAFVFWRIMISGESCCSRIRVFRALTEVQYITVESSPGCSFLADAGQSHFYQGFSPYSHLIKPSDVGHKI